MDITNISQAFHKLGLQERPPQLKMIQDVFKALEQSQIFCIEAPTGTGKTISYLIASYLSKKSKQSIIVSTATIALQEQLIHNDLPLLSKLLETDIQWALAKGRRRYVCLARLYSPDNQHDLFAQASKIGRLQQALEDKRWNGDRDALKFQINDSEWHKVSTDAAGCVGKRCEFYDKCVFFKNRKKIYQADFVVTNHNLLLADIEVGSGTLLPELEKSIYILDECHHLPEKALHHFAREMSLADSFACLNQFNKVIQRLHQQKWLLEQQRTTLDECSQQIAHELKHLRDTLTANQFKFQDNIWHIQEPIATLTQLFNSLAELGQVCLSQSQVISADLAIKFDQHKTSDPELANNIAKQLASLDFLSSQLSHFCETCELFTKQPHNKAAPIAKWFSQAERFIDGSRVDDFSCHCTPINVSDKLRRLFWDKLNDGAILCSATIRSLNKFDDFLRKVGLLKLKQVVTSVMPAFFAYQQSLIFIPKMRNEPTRGQQDAHREETITLLPQLFLPNSGTLVLFTSRDSMKKVYANMPNELADNILIQGEKAKSQLIAQHKQNIDANQQSIIFGLASFAEGLDLPARYCQHVIIHKLPFAVPTHPVELTRSAWLEKNNLNAFMLTSLPATSLKLNQYAGRLIRRETDFGIVTILDRRLYTKFYGQALLNNLPKFSYLINQDIATFKKQALVLKLFECNA